MIPLGVELYAADTIEETETWLTGKGNNSLFFNINEKDNEFVDYIQRIRQKDLANRIKIAVYLPQDNHNCLRKLYKTGITAFIYKSSIPDHIMTQMISIVNYLEQEGERRGHIRIPLTEVDNIQINFTFRGKEFNGLVTMISPVALSFKPPYMDLLTDTAKKEIISNISLNINSEIVYADALIARIDETVALMFVNIKEDFLHSLCNFIFKKLNNRTQTK
jgi:hypothetical protein